MVTAIRWDLPVMQNKANFPIADFGLRIADWGQTCGWRLRLRGPIVQ
jgi:hypothetical protein